MDAITTVKTQIKAWEREFRAQNGRNASVEDIKAQPHIAEKYKLYKKLTKEAEAKSSRGRQAPEAPKTPPRPTSKRPDPVVTAAILPKSRPVASTADIWTKNPFSPVKRKHNAGNSGTSSSRANPFLTPVKKRASSPGPPSPPPSTSLLPLPAPAAVISRARKRLHGEPVSPSPKPRDKRRRLDAHDEAVHTSCSRSPSPRAEEGDSFVDDSPVKAPTGKAFTPLFEEAKMHVAVPLIQPIGTKTDLGNRSKVFGRAKTVPGGLFGSVKENRGTRAKIGSDVFGNTTANTEETAKNGKRKDREKEQSIDGIEKSNKRRALPGPKGLIPSKNDLFEAKPQAASSSSSSGYTNTSRKRSLSEAMKDEEKRAISNVWGLLPPSPPPADDKRWPNGIGKGKAKASYSGKGKSKTTKLSSAGSDEEMENSSEEAEITTVSWRGRPQSSQPTNADDTTLELEPELRFHLHARHRVAPLPSASPPLEKFEVDLPDEMRRVLALSPNEGVREKEEEDVVRGLLNGVKKHRGDIWRPGEIGGEDRDSDKDPVADDDWEGEGVPWEIAEL